MIAKVITLGENRDDSINNMIQLLNEIEIEGISSNKSFLLTVLKNKLFLEANFNTKFIENNLDFLLQKKEIIKSLKVDKKATEKLRKEKENIPPPQATPTIKKKSKQKEEASSTSVPPITGEIYDKPKFLPGGDKYMLIEFGNVMDLELNFTAQNLAQAIQDHKVTGVYETAPCFASMLVHYEPE